MLILNIYFPTLFLLPISAVSVAITTNETTLPSEQKKIADGVENHTSSENQPDTISRERSTSQIKAVKVTNNIEQSMLTYKHWTGKYEPSTFVVSIDGQTIEQNKEYNILVTDSTLKVRYDYSFINGMRKGAKIIKFQLEKNAVDLLITFSWNDEWRVIIDQATPVEIKEAKFSTKA